MIYTTLNNIRAYGPCEAGWAKLLRNLDKTAADDDALPLVAVLDSNGLNDTLWCLRAVPEHDREWRLFAIWCARRVQHLMTDPRSLAALDVAERYASGDATQAEKAAAETAAGAAAWAAAGAAAQAAAWAAAQAAAETAAWAAAWAAAETAAETAAGAAAWAAARAEQEAELRRIIS